VIPGDAGRVSGRCRHALEMGALVAATASKARGAIWRAAPSTGVRGGFWRARMSRPACVVRASRSLSLASVRAKVGVQEGVHRVPVRRGIDPRHDQRGR
jgi:hypothetical protein